jgi:transglutaminase-like putative cysteine protease
VSICRLFAVLCAAAASVPASATERTFALRYSARIAHPPKGQALDLFVPLPARTGAQDVLSLSVAGAMPGKEVVEERFGNRYWHGTARSEDGKPIEVAVVATVRRRSLGAATSAVGSGEAAAALARFLLPDKRVPLRGGPLEKIDAEIIASLGARASDRAALAKAIYDYVVDNMEYKKVGTGWGNGDTFWACSAKYGNCTDFHALLLSLARRNGIPARFKMGFPFPEELKKANVAGYHCWVELWLPGRGWIPVDASEARKHPEKREAHFGGQPPDRVELSEGRDLALPGMKGEPLNYFVYPYLEVGGRPSGLVTWELQLEELPAG